MTTRRKVLLAVAGVLLLLLAAGSIAFLSSERFAGWQKRLIEARLSRLLERDVTVESLTLEPLAGAFEARGILAAPRDGVEEPPFFSVAGVSGEVRFRSLLVGRVVFDRLEIDEPVVNLRRAEGQWNWPSRWKGGGRVKIEARRVRLRDGIVRIEDVERRFDLQGESIRIEARGSGRRKLEGTVEARRVAIATPRTDEATLSLSGAFILAGDRISVSHFRVGGDWMTLAGGGEIFLSSPVRSRWRGSIRLESEAVRFKRSSERMDGEMLFEGEVTWTGRSWSVEGALRSEEIHWKNMTFQRIEGPVRGEKGVGIVFGPATATAWNGRLDGTVHFFVGLGGGGKADFRASGCHLREVLGLTRRPVPVDARITGEGSARWSRGGWSTAQGSVRLKADRPASPGPGLWPVSGSADLAIREGMFRIVESQATANAATIVAQGRVDPRARHWDLDFTFSSPDMAAASPLLFDCSAALGLDPAGWRIDTASGAGVVTGKIELRDRSWTGQGTFAGNEFSIRGGDWGQVVGRFRLLPHSFRLTGVEGRREDERVSVEMVFERKGDDFSVSGTVEGWEAREVLSAGNLDLGVEGPISGRFIVARSGGEITAEGEAILGAGRVRGFDVEGGHVSFRASDGMVDFRPLQLDVAGGTFEMTGSLAIDDRPAEAVIRWKDVRLEGLTPLRSERQLAGPTDGGGTLSSGRGVRRFAGNVSSQGVLLGEFALGPAAGRLDTDFDSLGVDLTFPTVSARVEGSVGLSAPHGVEGTIAFDSSPVDALLAMARLDQALPDVSGRTTALFHLRGPLDRLEEMRLQGRFGSLRLDLGPARMDLAGPADLQYRQGRVELSRALLEGEGSRLSVSGWLAPGGTTKIGARCEGELDLRALQAVLKDTIVRGTMAVDLTAEGDLARPLFSGQVQVDGGRIRRFDVPLLIGNLSLKAGVEGRQIEIGEVSATLGGGTIRGSGRILIEGFLPSEFDAKVHASAVSLEVPRGFRGTYTGNLVLSGTPELPSLNGDVEMIRGLYRKDFRLEAFSLTERTREFEPTVGSEELVAGDLSLNLNIRAEDGLWLKNDFGNVENRAEIVVGGTLARPEITGRVTSLEGGRIRFRRVDYRLREGSVRFAGGGDPPDVNLLADTRISGYEITLHVFGPLDRPEYALTSNPSLPEEQVISLLVTGSPYSMAGTETGTTGDLAGAYLGGTVTGYIERPLEKLFGVDSIRIDPLLLAGEADPTTRVTIGKRLTSDLLVLYSRDVGGEADEIYGLEYQLNRKLVLFGEGGSSGGIGGDLRYTTRFRLKSPPENRSPQPEKRRENDRPAVAWIRFEGDVGADVDDLARQIELREGEPFRRRLMQQGAAAIKSSFVERDYLEARVVASSARTDDGVGVTYSIRKGRKIRVRVEGAGRHEKEVRRELRNLWQESLFTEDLLSEAEMEIARFFRRLGHYTVLVNRTTQMARNGALEVTFTVDPGELVMVDSVTIVGNEVIDDDRIRKQMLTAPDTLFTRSIFRPQVLDDDLLSIRRLYRDQGFSQVTVDPVVTVSADGRTAQVQLVVSEGSRSSIRRIDVDVTDDSDDENLVALLPFEPGVPYSPLLVSQGQATLSGHFDGDGFPDVRVTTDTERSGTDVDVIYRITKGQRRTIERVEIHGNRRTSERVIRRELQLAPGDPVSRGTLRRAQQRLYRLGIFEAVNFETTPLGEGGEGAVLRVRIVEAPGLSLALGAGYDSENGPRGTFEIADVNFRGRGRYVGLQTRVSSREDRVQAIVKTPRLLGRSWDSILTAFWERQQRESFDFDRFGVSGQVRRDLGRDVTGLLRAGASISDVDPAVPDSILDDVQGRRERGRVSLGSVGASLLRDTRDTPFSPKKGTLLAWDMRVFAGSRREDPRASPKESLLFGKVFLQGTYQRGVGERAVWAGSTRLGIAPRFRNTERVPLVERFFGGGDTTVRGFPRDLLGSSVERDGVLDDNGDGKYDADDFDDPRGTLIPVPAMDEKTGEVLDRIVRLEPIGGEAMVIFNQELRFPIRGSFGGVVFYDAGGIFRSSSDIKLSKLRHAVGTGLRVETPVGPIRLEYGRKINRQPGESRGRFYLSIGPTF